MTMIKKLAVLAAATTALAATPAAAQDASDSTGTASVNIVQPMTLTKDSDLDFGTVILSGAGAWSGDLVEIDDANTRTCAANLTCAGAGGTSAAYTLDASGDAGVSVTIPDTVTISNGVDPDLTVDLLPENSSALIAASATQSGDTFSFTMPSGGSFAFAFGGEIALASTTGDGLYSGSITVTADYQ